jgi:hypothetical protein
MALVVGRYEGKQNFKYPYNKGHKLLFIILKLHTQQQNIIFKLI